MSKSQPRRQMSTTRESTNTIKRNFQKLIYPKRSLYSDWPFTLKLPLVGGHEGTGIVVAKGELVEGIEIGDHASITVSLDMILGNVD
jgi:hypothetical protein